MNKKKLLDERRGRSTAGSFHAYNWPLPTIGKSLFLGGKRYKNRAWLCYNKKHIGRRHRSRGAARPYEAESSARNLKRMRILVFSDSHTDVSTMADVVRRMQPDRILHLGDHYSDAEALMALYPGIPFHAVMGNTDFTGNDVYEQSLILEGKHLFLTHGHFYGVKTGLSSLMAKGASLAADLVLFGHTHIPYLDWNNDMYVMNPGSINRRGRRFSSAAPAPTFGLITLENGKMQCDVKEL